jgi:hypothetical protein
MAPRIIAIIAAVILSATRVDIRASTLVFSEPDFEWHQTGFPASPYHIWVAGDFWAQNFQGTDLTSANEISLSLLFDSMTPLGPDLLDLDVLLNGFNIGNFSVPAGVTGSRTFAFSFAPVTGPDYRIEIRASNTIPEGGGSVSIALGGNSFATIVPEPSTISLLILATGMSLAFRFRKNRA